MLESEKLFDALKQLLKSRGMGYRELARRLEVSEPTVKRLFSGRVLTIGRLGDICAILDVSFLDLAKLAADAKPAAADRLSHDQEMHLAADRKLAAYFYLLLNAWKPDAIERDFEFNGREADRYLSALDQLGLIESHPGRKVRLKVSRAVSWSPSGPLAETYEKAAVREFLAAPFAAGSSAFHFRTGELSKASVNQLTAVLKRLAQDFDRIAKADSTLPKRETVSSGFTLAFRPFVFTLFQEFKRSKRAR